MPHKDYLNNLIIKLLLVKGSNFYEIKRKLSKLGFHLDKECLLRRIKRL